ncbi:hypothetical protein LTR84_007592 [Exophiala bonariae]|uniref:BTB domain-containing protein n=1 Tax=Exophiala bonariae TaxID=1690606 RepID=A0AAV9NM65_9EURO|nr:hypothetical protein LTR84_007592 [Exophiala bonariae]
MSSFINSKIVTVLVGPDEVEYYFHKDILVDSCPFFAKCLSVNMEEHLANIVRMPEDTTRAFHLLTLHLYGKTIPALTHMLNVLDNIEAWILADKLCMPHFQDILMARMMRYTEYNYIFPGYLADPSIVLNPDSILGKFLRDQVIHDMARAAGTLSGAVYSGMSEETWDGLLGNGVVDSRMILDLVTAAKSTPVNPSKQGCKYHVHGTTGVCMVPN